MFTSSIVAQANDVVQNETVRHALDVYRGAQQVLKVLNKENRTVEAMELTKQTATLNESIIKLQKNIEDQRWVHEYEIEAKQTEERIQMELRLIHRRSEIKNGAAILETVALDGVVLLRSKNQNVEASAIEKQVEVVKKLVSQLAYATTKQQLANLDHKILEAEQILTEQLSKANIIHDHDHE